jgi:hypothetical protein
VVTGWGLKGLEVVDIGMPKKWSEPPMGGTARQKKESGRRASRRRESRLVATRIRGFHRDFHFPRRPFRFEERDDGRCDKAGEAFLLDGAIGAMFRFPRTLDLFAQFARMPSVERLGDCGRKVATL